MQWEMRGQNMRYDKGHKDATRERIIDVASRQFREHGVAAVGLAGIMNDAGLTNGAFYAHFSSKEDLVREVLAKPGKRNEMWQAAAESGAGLASTIRGYLSSAHRDNPGRGCPISALRRRAPFCLIQNMAQEWVYARLAAAPTSRSVIHSTCAQFARRALFQIG